MPVFCASYGESQVAHNDELLSKDPSPSNPTIETVCHGTLAPVKDMVEEVQARRLYLGWVVLCTGTAEVLL